MTNLAAMPLLDHLQEMRKRLIVSAIVWLVCAVVAFMFYSVLIRFLSVPFHDIQAMFDQQLYVTSLFEGFVTKMKLSMVFGLVLSSPVHVFQILRFMFPGMSKKERRIVLISLLASFLLAIGSFSLSYYKILPFSVSFLTSAGFIPQKVGVLLNYQQNIFYVFNFIVYCMLFFQFPIVLEILLALNVVKRRWLLKHSRTIIIVMFVVAALVTPPDFISQVSIAVPLIGLYFLTILVAKVCKFGE